MVFLRLMGILSHKHFTYSFDSLFDSLILLDDERLQTGCSAAVSGKRSLLVVLGSARFVSTVVMYVDVEEGSFVF